jgi:hypothetical protein
MPHRIMNRATSALILSLQQGHVTIDSLPRKDAWDYISIFSTLALVVIGAITFVAVWYQAKKTAEAAKSAADSVREMSRQAALLERQTKATEVAAEAAKNSAIAGLESSRTVINSERAWIEIKLGAPEPDALDEQRSDLFTCAIKVENHGRTVARIETVGVGLDTVDGPLPKEPSNLRKKNFQTLLGSGQSDVVAGFDADNFADWRDILNGKKRGVLRITVKYRDVLDASMIHETSATYVFERNLEEEPERISALSVYT